MGEDLRQSMMRTFQAAVFDGRLSDVITAVKKQREAKELESMRQCVQNTLQTSLLDGRLLEAVRALKEERKAKEVDTLRQRLQSTLKNSLADGRLSDVICNLKSERRVEQKLQNEGIVQQEVLEQTVKPVKPAIAKTSTRPTRRSSLRTTPTVEQESQAMVEAVAAPTPSVLPSKPPTLPCSVAGDRSPQKTLLTSTQCPPSPRARLTTLARPASPVGALP